MAINFVQGKFESLLDSGAVNSGGDVALFETGGTYSTAKTTYTTYALTTPNAHPAPLDSAGRATIYFNGDADVRVRDSAGATVYTQRNVNPVTTITVTNVTVATTISVTNDQYITTTADLTLPTAATAGDGWLVTIKNLDTVSHTIARGTSGDTINSASSEFTLPARQSVRLVVNDGITGFDVYFNPLLEITTGSSGQALVLGSSGPAWTTVDLINPGSDLYLYNNFT